MVDMVMEDPMEAMVVIEAMVVMDMERERLKLSQVMVMEVMDMEDLMEVMVDTEAMEVMVMERERLKLSQDMDMEVMDMEDLMVDMVVMEDMVMEDHMDTEAMDMVVMVMESNQVFLLNATPIIKLLLNKINSFFIFPRKFLKS